jgi:organic hydroperoxide reductase OsmC/OhrA
MKNEFQYTLNLKWLGDENGSHHRNDRFYEISIEGKPKLKGSADKPFFGDPSLYNPEDLLMSALSSCHMMSFLYLCRKEGIAVKAYSDSPVGLLKVNVNGGGQFESVKLYPVVELMVVSNLSKLKELHERAGKLCFIANSVNFPIEYIFDY